MAKRLTRGTHRGCIAKLFKAIGMVQRSDERQIAFNSKHGDANRQPLASAQKHTNALSVLAERCQELLNGEVT